MSSNAVWCACSACCGAITGNEDPSLDSRLGVVTSRKTAKRHCSKYKIYHDVCEIAREAGKLQLEQFWPIGSVHPGWSRMRQNARVVNVLFLRTSIITERLIAALVPLLIAVRAAKKAAIDASRNEALAAALEQQGVGEMTVDGQGEDPVQEEMGEPPNLEGDNPTERQANDGDLFIGHSGVMGLGEAIDWDHPGRSL